MLHRNRQDKMSVAMGLRAGFAAALLLLVGACSKLDDTTTLFGDSKETFAGATVLLAQGDGTWTLQWNALSSVEAVYRVYRRTGEAQYDFTCAAQRAPTLAGESPASKGVTNHAVANIGRSVCKGER